MPSLAESEAPIGTATLGSAGLGQRLLRNLVMQSGSQVVMLALGVVTSWVLSRKLGVIGFGTFNYMLMMIYLGLAMADLGVSMIVLREVARFPDRTESLIQVGMGLKLTLALMALSGVVVFASLTQTGDVWWAIVIFSLTLPIQALGAPSIVLQARVMIRRGLMPEMANRLTGFVLMMAAAYSGLGLVGVAAALIVGELAGLTGILVATREFVRPRPRFNWAAWRPILQASLTLGMVTVITVLVNRLDVIMLESLSGMAPVGIYSAAYKLPNLLERLPLLAMATIFPAMSQLAQRDPAQMRALYRWSVTRATIIAVPMVAIVSVGAPWIIGLWYGPDYSGAVVPLRWLIWSTGCMYVSVIAANALTALGRINGSLQAWIVAGAANAVMNWWWIPRYGASGAAAATAVSFLIAMVISVWLVHRELDRAVARMDVGAVGAVLKN